MRRSTGGGKSRKMNRLELYVVGRVLRRLDACIADLRRVFESLDQRGEKSATEIYNAAGKIREAIKILQTLRNEF